MEWPPNWLKMDRTMEDDERGLGPVIQIPSTQVHLSTNITKIVNLSSNSIDSVCNGNNNSANDTPAGGGVPTPVYPTPPGYTLPSRICYPLGYPTPGYTFMGIPHWYPLPGYTIHPPWVKATPRRDLVPRIPYPLDRMTHTCENVTFPQFRWRSVTRI